jgi:hypothetical protein
LSSREGYSSSPFSRHHETSADSFANSDLSLDNVEAPVLSRYSVSSFAMEWQRYVLLSATECHRQYRSTKAAASHFNLPANLYNIEKAVEVAAAE